MFEDGASQVAENQITNLYSQVIDPLRAQVSNYRVNFNADFNQWARENNVLRKMRQSLDPGQNRSEKIEGLQRGSYKNNKKATQNLMLTMLKGHQLMLDIREVFTNQIITTKFIVQTDEKAFYEIDESKLNAKSLTLSAYGGGTVSNPFSLAYELSKDMLSAAHELNDDTNNISGSAIIQHIMSVKEDYLKKKKEDHPERDYSKKYFDAKDAEIYESYMQSKKDIQTLTSDEYYSLRKKMNKNNIPFYKMGDVGSVQVKFFNLKQESSSTAVNFARFSLLRDRLAQLEQILTNTNLNEMKEELVKFFTVDNESSIVDAVSQEFNQMAQNNIRKLFDKILT